MSKPLADPCQTLTAAIESLRTSLDELSSLQPQLEQAFAQNTLAPSLLQQYNQLLEKLTQADGERIASLTAMGVDITDMDAALAHCHAAHLTGMWAVVCQQLPQVAITNRKHAQFLYKATASIQTGLGLLGASGNQPPLYGPSGQKEASLSTRTLGSA